MDDRGEDGPPAKRVGIPVKVAREGRDKFFTFSFWCIFGANNFFSSKFSGKGVGAMPYLLTNFWSRDSMYDGFF